MQPPAWRARRLWTPLLAGLAMLLAIATVATWSPQTTTAASGSWATYQHDAARTGVDPDQPAVTGASMDWSIILDGNIFAQPLVVGNTVIAATQNNSVYAIDATSHAILWRTNVGTPATSGLPSGCGDPLGVPSDPIGILGTPVVDTANGIVYVAALTQPGGTLQYTLNALNLSNGGQRYSVPINPQRTSSNLPAFSAAMQDQRAALTLSQGRVYVEFGGLSGDCNNYRGWVWTANASDGSSPLTYETPATAPGAGIWDPAGGSVDASGNLFVPTGNSEQASAPDHSESVIKLSPTLQELSFFTASNWAALNNGDIDIGSFGPLQLTNSQFPQYNGLVFQGGKNGQGYILNGSNLGGVGGQMFTSGICGSEIMGGAAYVPPTIYVGCTTELDAVHLSTSGSPSFTASRLVGGYSGGLASGATTPIFSGGRVWNLDVGASHLVMYDPSSGQAQTFNLTSQPVHFASPASGAGHIFVPAGSDLDAFALQSAGPTPTPTNTPVPGTPTSTPLPQTCPCTIFPSSATPTTQSGNDSNSVELGVKFTVDTPGSVTGIRFFKGSTNTGTHVGNLWTSSGTLLATATFTGESASGWQQVNFSSPVAVTPGNTYVASYFAPTGHYADDLNYFVSSVDRSPLHAPSSASSGGNGVYHYATSSTFPNSTFNSSNYWVDVVFATASSPTATPTPTSSPTPTSTPRPASTSTPTPTPTPSVGGTGFQTITFDDLSSPNRVLNGQYPSGVIDWGANAWWLSGPYGQFTTNSISFNGGGPTSETFTFVSPRVLAQIDAFNGGSGSTTITLSCAGLPTVTVSLGAGQLQTISTGWSNVCATVTVGSSNGWWTNFDNLQISTSGSAPTATPTATATPVPPVTVTFDDRSNTDQPLTGQYPAGVIDWGSSGWWLSGPYGSFTTNSVSFTNGPTSGTFNLVSPRKVLQVDAFNGGSSSTTVTLACSGQPTVSVNLAAGQMSTITTNWTYPCSSVTITSSNGWFTNFDNLVLQ